MPVVVIQKAARKASKRLRRLTWTASALVVLLAICAVVTWRIRKENQPEEYVPGEESSDITNVVADRGAQKSAPTPETARSSVTFLFECRGHHRDLHSSPPRAPGSRRRDSD